MRIRLIKIGDGHGLLIPEAIWERLLFQDEVELEVQGDRLIVRGIPGPRMNWEKQFAAMAANNDDQLLDSEAFCLTEWDKTEWEW